MRGLLRIAGISIAWLLFAAAAEPPHHGQISYPERSEKSPLTQTLREEHAALQTGLREALVAKGRTEAAARELAEVLNAHIKRSDRLILPLLAMQSLPPKGYSPKRRADADEMARDLAKEEGAIKKEQEKLATALATFRSAAEEEGKPRFLQFAEILELHVKKEQDFYLPAARQVAARFHVDSQDARP